MDEGCIFCAIVNKQLPAATVAEDDITLTIMSLQPINPGHVLVIRKRHEEQFQNMDPDSYVACMLAARSAGQAIEGVFSPKRVGLLIAGFDVKHVHVHILPLHDYHDVTSRALLEGRVSEAPMSELIEVSKRLQRMLRNQQSSDQNAVTLREPPEGMK